MQLCCRAIRWQQPQHLGCWNGDGLWFGMFFPPQTFAYSSHQTVVFWQSFHNSSYILPYPLSFWECLNHLTPAKVAIMKIPKLTTFQPGFQLSYATIFPVARARHRGQLPFLRLRCFPWSDTLRSESRIQVTWRILGRGRNQRKHTETFWFQVVICNLSYWCPKTLKVFRRLFYVNTIASDEDMN